MGTYYPLTAQGTGKQKGRKEMGKELAQEFMSVVFRMKQEMNRLRQQGGWPPLSLRVLHTICHESREGKAVKISDISDALTISRPATTQILNDLEKRGYIVREMNRHDRRVVTVQLTKEGEEALRTDEENALAILDHVLGRMGEQNTRELMRLLEQLVCYFHEAVLH